MRKILSFWLALGTFALLSGSASAVDRCHIPPPAFWFAPKVTNVYEGGSRPHYASASYSSTTSHTFSAQRRYAEPRRYSEPPRYTPTHLFH